MGPLGLWNICTITSAGSIQSFKLFSVLSLFCFAALLLPPPHTPLHHHHLHPRPCPPFTLAAHTTTTTSTWQRHQRAPSPSSLQQKYRREHQSRRMKDYLVALVNKSMHSKQFYHVLNMISTSMMFFVSWNRLGDRGGKVTWARFTFYTHYFQVTESCAWYVQIWTRSERQCLSLIVVMDCCKH